MSSTDRNKNATLDLLWKKCKCFRDGEGSVDEFREIVRWGKSPPNHFGLLEFKQYFVELDPNEVSEMLPEWAAWGRKELWLRKDEKHNEDLGRLQNWQPPQKPVADEFHLARYWPRYMESLRPFPEGADTLLEIANEVHRFVAGTQLFSKEYSTKRNKYTHEFDTFLVSSCVVHFKLVAPIIRELDAREYKDEYATKLRSLLEGFCLELIKVRAQLLESE